MTLQYQTVNDYLLRILRDLMQAEPFAGLVLAGGTALCLQRGHRKSTEIALFAEGHYGSMPIKEMRTYLESHYAVHDGTEWMDRPLPAYTLMLGHGDQPPVRVVLSYCSPFSYQLQEADGIRMADQRDIAAMKLQAIATAEPQCKDFWDLADLMRDYPLPRLVDYTMRRKQNRLTREQIAGALMRVRELPEAGDCIINLRPLAYWDLIAYDIEREAAQLLPRPITV